MTNIAASHRLWAFFAFTVSVLAPALLAQEPSVTPAGAALPLGGPALREARTDRQIGEGLT